MVRGFVLEDLRVVCPNPDLSRMADSAAETLTNGQLENRR